MNAPEKSGARAGKLGTPKTNDDSREGISYWSAKGKTSFGPFRDVDAELVKLAGWGCRRCKRPVRRLGLVVPKIVPRMMLHACTCICVTTWEDEHQVTPKMWPGIVKLGRRRRVDLIMFNGGKDTPAGFQGIN